MLYNDLFNSILLKPVEEYKADKILIIAGYASSAMAYNHLAELKSNVSIDLVIGMANHDGIAYGSHLGYKNLTKTDYSDRFHCKYYTGATPIHSKSYIWLSNDKPVCAFTGSANYSQRAFLHKTQEAMVIDNPNECFDYYNYALADTINCTDDEVSKQITFFKESYHKKIIIDPLKVDEKYYAQEESDNVILSLLDRSGDMPQRSGLNWGQRPGRDPNQAYLAVPIKIARENFFPIRAQHFSLITDDGFSFDCTVAQDNDKAIETTQSNALLGKYFRQRLGVENGELITKEHLQSYGRTDVKIHMVDEENYLMDFSI